MNKLEPICRVLADFGWLCEVELMQQEGEEVLTREEYIDQCWTSYLTEARAVVQSQIKMLDKDLYIGFEDECIVRAWLRSLMEPKDAPDKSLSQKMHEAGFTPRKQGKAVREDE